MIDLHAQWKAAQKRLGADPNLVQWNVIVGSALLQYQTELKERISDVVEKLQDFHARNIAFNNVAEKPQLEETWGWRKWCQD